MNICIFFIGDLKKKVLSESLLNSLSQQEISFHMPFVFLVLQLKSKVKPTIGGTIWLHQLRHVTDSSNRLVCLLKVFQF